jgi:glycosyltransferase involved in cell wall biosynthesis
VAKAPLRILHVVQSLGYGGMESRIARLSRGLPRDAYRVEVLSLRAPAHGQVELAPGTPHHVFPIPPGLHLKALWGLSRFIRAGGYDIVHTHNWASMFYGVLAAKLARRPLAVHGEHGLNRSDLDGTPWKRLWAQRLLARLADWIVPVNPPIAAHVRKEWKLDGSRMTVIQNGVDLARFKPKPAAADTGTFTIGMVGRLDDVKDIGTALRAVKALIDQGKGDGVRLILVGDGPMRASLEAQAKTLGIPDRVEFAGARADVEAWYGKFDVFVNASVYEGMCNTLLEALACGLPLLASAVPGNRAWLRDGVDARFFPAGDSGALAAALSALRNDPAERAAMGARNRKRAEAEFDNQGFIATYAGFYDRLTAAARPGR